MRKNLLIVIVLLFSSVFLYWCGEKVWFKYEFENFYGTFNTEKTFEDDWVGLDWLWYNLLKNSIVKIYYQKDSEPFNESIIISKKISDMDVERFAKENIENVDISWLKLSKWKNVDIKCDWITPSFVYYQWKYGMNQYNIYLSEWFLKVGSSVYIISYATLDEKSRNDFSSSFKTIQCK